MSIPAMEWARRQRVVDPDNSKVSSGAKFVLMMLADRASPETWTCFPSFDLLEEETHIKPRTLTNHMALLERVGLIEKVRSRSKSGQLKGYEYRLDPARFRKASHNQAQNLPVAKSASGQLSESLAVADDRPHAKSAPGRGDHRQNLRLTTGKICGSNKKLEPKEHNPKGKRTILTDSSKKLSPEKSVFEGWNSLADELGLPKATKLTAERKRSIALRLHEHGDDAFDRAFEKIRGSPHCRGENRNGWRIALDNLLRKSLFLKLLEGNYDDRSSGQDRSAHAGQGQGRDRQQRGSISAIVDRARAEWEEDQRGRVPGFDSGVVELQPDGRGGYRGLGGAGNTS